ncbi:Calx-beta domain-containing protein, partial [Planctomycetota bacterium]
LTNTVKAQIVAQTDVVTALEQLAVGNTDAATIVSAHTGAALETLINAATPGIIIPPALIVRHVAIDEGDSGTSNLIFQVDIVGEPTQPVTVDYATSDGTATVADGDYVATNGTLTWGVGDASSRFVIVTANGDERTEFDEHLALILDTPINGVLRADIGYGYLLDDDIAPHIPSDELSPTYALVQLATELDSLSVGHSELTSGGDLLVTTRTATEQQAWRVNRRTTAATPIGEIPFYGQVQGLFNDLVFVSDFDNRSTFTIPLEGGTITTLGNFVANGVLSHPDGNRFYTDGYDDGFGHELWVSDGTASNTDRVIDLNPGPARGFGSLKWTTFHESELYFTGGDGSGFRIWKSNPTSGVTSMVSDQVSPVTQMVSHGDYLYFAGTNNDIQYDVGGLWRTDGTAEGTELVVPFENDEVIRNLFVHDETIHYFTTAGKGSHATKEFRFYSLTEEAGGVELLFDSTQFHQSIENVSERTRMRYGFNPSPFKDGFVVEETLFTGRRLVYVPTNPIDGGIENARVLTSSEWFSSFSGIAPHGERLLFTSRPTGHDPNPHAKLWMSDGEEDGLTLISTFDSGVNVTGFRDIGGHVFFNTVVSSTGEIDLWTVVAEPTANAGPPIAIQEGGLVILDAGGSHDPERAIVDYEWDFDFDGANFDVDASGIVVPFIAADNSSGKTAALRVTDVWGNSSVALKPIDVENVAPIVNGIGDVSTVLGAPLSIDAIVSDPGVNDSISTQWDLGDGTIIDDVLSVTHTYAADGEYSASLTATDSDGAVTVKNFRVVIGPPVTVTASANSLDEGQSLDVTAALTAVLSEDVIVPLAYSGTAIADIDFTATATGDAAPTSITIPAGQTSATIQIFNLNDALDEDVESLIITPGVPSNASLTSDLPIAINLQDDDAEPAIFVSSGPQVLNEDGTIVPLTVSLSEISGRDVVVSLASTGTAELGVDFTLQDTLLVIPAGETSIFTAVEIINDELGELTEQMRFEIVNSQNAVIVDTTSFPATLTHIITANDTPTVQFASVLQAVSETQGPHEIEVTLSNPSDATITVNYSIGGDAIKSQDYDHTLVEPIAFLPGDVTESLVFNLTDDSDVESMESLIVQIDEASNANIGPTPAHLTRIFDDDSMYLSLTTSRDIIWEDDTSYVTVAANLTQDAPFNIEVPITLSGTGTVGEHYFISTTTITIPHGSRIGTATIVLAPNDGIPERDLQIIVKATEIAEATFQGPKSVSIELRDDDPIVSFDRFTQQSTGIGFGGFGGAFRQSFSSPFESVKAPQRSNVLSDLRVDESAGHVTISVYMDKPVNRDVSVPVGYIARSAELSDFGRPGSVTIEKGKTLATLQIPIHNDQTLEDNETFSVRLASS